MPLLGIAKVSLKDCGSESMGSCPKKFLTDIETGVLYLKEKKCELLFFFTDWGFPSVKSVIFVRRRVASHFRLPVSRITIHDSHNHQSHLPAYFDPALSGQLSSKFIECAEKAVEVAVPVEMASVCVDVGSGFTINRRKYINSDLRVCTFFKGYKLVSGRADASRLVNDLVDRLYSEDPRIAGCEDPDTEKGACPDESYYVDSPVWYDKPVDSQVHLLVFRNEKGRNIGAVLRFAAHVQQDEPGYFSACFPAYVRDYLAEKTACPVLFANGPCGNIVPRIDGDSKIQSEIFSRKLVETVYEKFERKAVFSKLENISYTGMKVKLPLAEDLPGTPDEALEIATRQHERLVGLTGRKAPLNIVKKCAEEFMHARYMCSLYDTFGYLFPSQVRRGFINVYPVLLKLNDILISGFPGEVFSDITEALRRRWPGRDILTLTEVNGDIGYIPPRGEFCGGGYEVTFSMISKDSHDILLEKMNRAVLSCPGEMGTG